MALLLAQQAGGSSRGGPAAGSLGTAAPPGPTGQGQGTRPAQPFTSPLVSREAHEESARSHSCSPGASAAPLDICWASAPAESLSAGLQPSDLRAKLT